MVHFTQGGSLPSPSKRSGTEANAGPPMPISDTYLVQYLLESTVSAGGVAWRESDSEGYLAECQGVQVKLESIPTRAGARIRLTLSAGADSVDVTEPRRSGFFTHKFANPRDERLAQLLRDLYAAALHQCVARQDRSPEVLAGLRETLYRRVVGTSSTGDSGRLTSR